MGPPERRSVSEYARAYHQATEASELNTPHLASLGVIDDRTRGQENG